jgi:putative nucleotidyltransferase with HDIG domain
MMQLSSPNVLVVDDDPTLLHLLSDMLAPICAVVHLASAVDSAVQILRTQVVDVILADLCLPGERGTALLAYAAERQNDPAVIIMTGNATLNDALDGVHLHASDFLLKPFSIAKLRESVLRAFAELEERRALERVRTMPQSERLQLETLIATLDACEHDTCAHSLRVLEYCFHLAEMVGYPHSELPQLARAALLHDIGKIGIPQSILAKPGRLTPEEFEVMKSHVVKGVRILERVPTMRACIPVVLHHHERYDGGGYPNGTKSDDIPLGARIFTVADTFDAMTSDRPYRRAVSFEDASAEISRCAGQQFDPAITNAFLNVPATTWAKLRERAQSLSTQQFLAQLLQHEALSYELSPCSYGIREETHSRCHV